MTWKTVKLGDCCEVVTGATPDTTKRQYWDGDIFWATPKDLSELDSMYMSTTARRITQLGLQKCAANILPAGSVLFSSRAPIGHVAINTVPMCTNQGFKSFIPQARFLHNRYLYYWLRANKDRLQAMGKGATFKELSKALVSEIELPLPPIHLQERIADLLQTTDQLRSTRRLSLKKSDALLQSVFFHLFGDPVSNERNWPLSPLPVLFASDRPGTKCGPFGSALKRHEYTPEGVPVWGIDNVLFNRFVEHGSLFIPFSKFQDLTAYSVQRGDILITRAGTVGRMCVAEPSTATDSIIGTNLIRLSLDQSQVIPEYVCTLLSCYPGITRSLRASSDDGAYSFMNTGVLNSITIPLPPMNLQSNFLQCFRQIRALEAKQALSLNKLNQLVRAIEQTTFFCAEPTLMSTISVGIN